MNYKLTLACKETVKVKYFFYDINRYIYIYTYEEEIYIKKMEVVGIFLPLKMKDIFDYTRNCSLFVLIIFDFALIKRQN